MLPIMWTRFHETRPPELLDCDDTLTALGFASEDNGEDGIDQDNEGTDGNTCRRRST